MATGPESIDDFSAEELQNLKALAQDVDQAAEELNSSRRDVIKSLGLLGTGIAAGGISAQQLIDQVSAQASTTDGDGNVGLPSDRVDVFADGLDGNSATLGSLNAGELNNADCYVDTDDDLAQVATDAPDGSVIAILPGTHEAEGVPYRHAFVGYPGTTVELPDSPSDHLFFAESGVDLDGESLFNLTLDGGGTTTYDGIHLDDADRYNDGLIQNVDVTDFRRGYSGTQDDRQVKLIASRFRDSEVGVYVNSNHPNLVEVDCRNCETGLGGDIFDLKVTTAKFVRCDYGVRALDGGSINSSTFVNCSFFQCDEIGAELDSRCTVTGGLLVPPDSAGSSVGIDVTEASRVNSVLVRSSTGSEFGDVAIRANGAGIAGCTFYFMQGDLIDAGRQTTVAGNQFTAPDNGTMILLTGDTPSVTGNTVWIESDEDAQFIGTGDDESWMPTITGNSLTINPGATMTNPLVDLADTNGFGFVFTNNTFYGYSGTSGTEYIAGDAQGAIIKNNRAHRMEQGSLTTDGDTINTDNIETS